MALQQEKISFSKHTHTHTVVGGETTKKKNPALVFQVKQAPRYISTSQNKMKKKN